MNKNPNSLNNLSGLNAIVKAVYEAGKTRYEKGEKVIGEISFENLRLSVPEPTENAHGLLKGVLAFLRIIGLITIDRTSSIRATSRYAHYALGSLSKFLHSGIPVANEPIGKGEERYLIDLTASLERMRLEKKALLKPEDRTHIHYRKIVNVIIKGRQRRKGRETDVYLHVYHPEWKAYHLVGLSHKDDTKADDEIAILALLNQVGLTPDQYELDSMINPKEVEWTGISCTSGALTKYAFTVRVVKEVKVPLKLKNWVADGKFPADWFRWFTWEEILQKESNQGEPIMFTTPEVMKSIDLGSIPLSAEKADDPFRHVNIWDTLGRYISWWAFPSLLLIMLLSYLPDLFKWLGKPNAMLDNLSNLADIIQFLAPAITFLSAIIIVNKKK